MSAFKISANGNVLFFTENKEGKSAQNFDDTGEPTDAQTETRHRIMASIYVDGLFSEPFVLGQTAHALDSIAGVSGHSSYTFVTSSITDMANSMADMYYVDIPIVATATVLGFAAESVFTLQGEKASFTLVLRNDGNVILKGCQATLVDADTGEKADNVTLSFAAENLCASAWNPELFDDATEEDIAAAQAYTDNAVAAALEASGAEGVHLLADPAAAGVLIPGKTAQYRVTFTIPSNWHGTKNVYAALSEFSYETITSAAPDGAEVSPLDYQAHHDDLPRAELTVHASDEPFDPGLSAPAVGIVNDDGSVTPSGNGENGTGSSTGLTSTGDEAGLGMLGLAAGAAGVHRVQRPADGAGARTEGRARRQAMTGTAARRAQQPSTEGLRQPHAETHTETRNAHGDTETNGEGTERPAAAPAQKSDGAGAGRNPACRGGAAGGDPRALPHRGSERRAGRRRSGSSRRLRSGAKRPHRARTGAALRSELRLRRVHRVHQHIRNLRASRNHPGAPRDRSAGQLRHHGAPSGRHEHRPR